MKRFLIAGMLFVSVSSNSQTWVPDLGNGRYKNPVIYADYSDPDVIRVGKDFYMVSSSFNASPGLPVLHSTDLVNWTIVNHVFSMQEPLDVYKTLQHGNGCWAPSIRYHKGEFFVFYSDPDFGIYMSKTKDVLGEWETPILIHEGKGWIDPCPLWDDDGSAYLVNAFAGSRSGMKSILVVNRMSPDGSRLLGEGVLVFDGHKDQSTIEGPKFYKRNNYYYIFAPAGGVPAGWQTVLRSRNVFGPYEEKIVLHQGNTNINGPHQGAWVELKNHESCFLHFQDKGAYGRIVHLQPMEWKNDWPIIGVDNDSDGIGEPVETFRKPVPSAKTGIAIPQTSDEFNTITTGLQWQWQANPEPGWMFQSGSSGFMRLYCTLLPGGFTNLWQTPHLLLQKFPAPVFSATTRLNFKDQQDGDKTGLIIMGMDYSYISVSRENGKLYIAHSVCRNAINGENETLLEQHEIGSNDLFLRVEVSEGGLCIFSFSSDGKEFIKMKTEFKAVPGKWIGAKVGLFAYSTTITNDKGYADYDWFRIEQSK
jgi:beta-xylosidase